MKIETRTAVLFKDEDNIIHYDFKPNARVSYDDALENGMVLQELAQGKKHRMLSDGRFLAELSLEARRLAISDHSVAINLAVAVILKSTISKLIFSVFSSYQNLPYPTRAFTNEEKAREWLLSIPAVENGAETLT